MTEHHLTDRSFASLGLPEPLLAGIREAGFENCTPIQAESLPVALAGRDVAGQAQTGTGKTAAFLLAAFSHLLSHPPAPSRKATSPRVMILAPTRELAVQIHKDAEVLGKHTGFRLVLVFGGTGYDQQRKALEEGVDILIGTPGRLIDYYKQGIFDLDHVQVMVLDEADRMFDLGFIKDIRYLLRKLPPADQRLSMLFSATLSLRVTELAFEHMNEPQFVHIEPDKRTADKVTQLLYHTAMDEKIPLLVGLLRHTDPARSLVFINTKALAERLVAWLKANGFNAEVLSGDVPQNMRLRILKDFTEGRLPLLIATDVAARGLHIPDVSHVFNFDLPQNAEDYVHRIGRTARAGASGDAVSFACEKYVFGLPEIEAYIGHKIPVGTVTPELLPKLEPPKRDFSEGRERERGPRREGRTRDDRGRRPERRTREDRPGRDLRAQPVAGSPPATEAAPAVAPREEQVPTARDDRPVAQAERAPRPQRREQVKPAPERKPFVRPRLRRAAEEKPVIG